MRDYVLTQAQSRQAYGVVRVVRVWSQLEIPSRSGKIAELDDYLLNDMGLTRDVVQHLLSLPLTVDVDWEKERVLRMR